MGVFFRLHNPRRRVLCTPPHTHPSMTYATRTAVHRLLKTNQLTYASFEKLRLI